MLYRGFQINRVLRPIPNCVPGAEVVCHRQRKRCVEFVVSEPAANASWAKVGAAKDQNSAMRMVDRAIGTKDNVTRWLAHVATTGRQNQPPPTKGTMRRLLKLDRLVQSSAA